MTDVPAEWLPDPTGRHDHRYWDGTRWTEHVADAGVAAIDPFEAAVVEQPPIEQPPVQEPTVEQPLSLWSTPDPTAVQPAVAEPTVEEPAVVEPAVVEPTVVEPAVVEPTEPTVAEADGGAGHGSRRLILVIAVAALIAIVVVLVLLVSSRGDSTSSSSTALSGQLASRLRSSNALDAKDASCVADFMIGRIGTHRLKGVDLTGEQVPATLEPDFSKALGDGVAHCKVAPTIPGGSATTVPGSPSTLPNDPTSTAQTKQFFIQFYEQNVGLSPAQAECLANTMIDAVASGKVKVGSASTAFPDALKTCKIPADALNKLSGG